MKNLNTTPTGVTDRPFLPKLAKAKSLFCVQNAFFIINN
jgi:hypothetical protein